MLYIFQLYKCRKRRYISHVICTRNILWSIYNIKVSINITFNNCLSHLTSQRKRMWHLEQFLESIATSIIRFHGSTVTLRYDVFRQYVNDSCVQHDTRADLSDRVFPDVGIRCYVQSYAGNTVTKSTRSVTCVNNNVRVILVSAAGLVGVINVVITRYFYTYTYYL